MVSPIIRAKILAQLLNDKEAISFLSKFDLVSGGSEELLAKLISGSIDFSLIGSIAPLMHPNLFVKLLYQREFYIFVSKDNPLASRQEISFKEALDYPFILLDESFVHMEAFQNLNEKYKKKQKFSLIFGYPYYWPTGQLKCWHNLDDRFSSLCRYG